MPTFKEDKRVVINLFHSPVYVQESRHISPLVIMDQVTRLEVKPSSIEFECLRKARDAATKVSQLMHRRRFLLKPLRLVDGPVLHFGKVVVQLRQMCRPLSSCLAIYQMKGEVVHKGRGR